MPTELLDPAEILATQMPPGKPLVPDDGGGDLEPEETEEDDDEEDG